MASTAPPLALSVKLPARLKRMLPTVRLTVSTTLVLPPVPKMTAAPWSGTMAGVQEDAADQTALPAVVFQVAMSSEK